MKVFNSKYLIALLWIVKCFSLKERNLNTSKKTLWMRKMQKKFTYYFVNSYIWFLIMTVSLCSIFLFPSYAKILNRRSGEELGGKKSIRSLAGYGNTQAPDCIYQNCRFTCANSSNLNKDILDAFEKSKCFLADVLNIEQQKFPNQTLSKAWLKNNIAFSEITLSKSDINNINSETFNTESFTATFSLSLIHLPIANLAAGTLLGLSRLKYLTIECELEHIDRGFFQPVSGSLRFLKLSHMKGSVKLDTIFGISKMLNLIHLDLSSNNFGDRITMFTFRHLSKVKYLKLSNCKITALSADAFRPIKNTLKYLDLSQNYLTNIEIDSFKSILPNGVYIKLGDNPWNCNCNLQPLIEYYQRFPNQFLDIPYCKHPQKYYGIGIADDSFCDNETTITPENNDKTSTMTTSKGSAEITNSIESTETGKDSNTLTTFPSSLPQKSLFRMACSSPLDTSTSTQTNNDYLFLNLAPPRYNFTIILVNETAVKIIIEELNDHLSILWQSDLDEMNSMYVPQAQYGCHILYNQSIIISELKDNVSYTFCLIPDGETAITPFNCQPFHVPVAEYFRNENKSWISIDKKRITLAIITVVMLTSTCLGGVLSYYVLKFYPELLRRSKHVLIVKKSAAYISTISGTGDTLQSSLKFRKKITPPPPYQSEFNDPESTYEDPEEIKGYETPRRHTYSFDRCEFQDFSPKSPPPLPKRNSEPSNKTLDMNKYQRNFICIDRL